MAVSVPHESHGPGAEDLYRDVFPSLLAYVRSRGQMRRFEDPEDVCQEVIVQVWCRRRAGTEMRSALGFARKLAHDRSVDVRRRPELEIVDLPELDELEIDRSELGPDVQVAECEEIAHLVEVVEERLAPRHRAVLELRSAGFKEAEIATRLGLSERQVGRVLDEAPERLGPACEVLAARGRCAMLALTIEDVARGRIGPESPRWGPAHRHLASCSQCCKRLTMIKQGVAA